MKNAEYIDQLTATVKESVTSSNIEGIIEMMLAETRPSSLQENIYETMKQVNPEAFARFRGKLADAFKETFDKIYDEDGKYIIAEAYSQDPHTSHEWNGVFVSDCNECQTIESSVIAHMDRILNEKQEVA